MSIYYLSRDYKYKRLNDAGNKARLYIEQTMDKIGFLPIGKRRTISKNKILHFFRTLAFVFLIPFKIHKKDILIIQYPTKYYDTIFKSKINIVSEKCEVEDGTFENISSR